MLKLNEINIKPGPKNNAIIHALKKNIVKNHNRLGVKVPQSLDHLSTSTLVASGEQQACEIRPATINKLMILSTLAKEKGYTPLFLFCDSDVASKGERLTSWALPHHRMNDNGEFSARLRPAGTEASSKKISQLPLKWIKAPSGLTGIRDKIIQKYDPVTSDKRSKQFCKIMTKSIYDLLEDSAQNAASLAEFGQKSCIGILQKLGIDNILFASQSDFESALFDQGYVDHLHDIAHGDDGNLFDLPDNAAPYWGCHQACGGRVFVNRQRQGHCLRCNTTLDAQAWQFLSLRAIPRMYALSDSAGIDLFVTGGSSPYNEQLGEICRKKNKSYFPVIWNSTISYRGPFQSSSDKIYRHTTLGKYSFIDAIIGAGHESMAAENDIAEDQYVGLSYAAIAQKIIRVLDAGVHYAQY